MISPNTRQKTRDWLSKRTREAILFVIGCIILIVEVVNSELRNNDVHSGIIVLGCTLCGVGVLAGYGVQPESTAVTQAKDGK